MLSVLYVDDEPGLLEVARLFLEYSGEFRVTTSISAQKALDSPEIQSYDAIISDYQMPGMDGIAFLKTVRQRSPDIPFILFTGRGREEVVIEAINNGADFYLQKGGDPKAQFAELTHKIRQAVARRQAECSLLDSERRLSDIINFLPDATFAIDKTGTVIAWNRAMEEMTGTGASDVLGRGNYIYGRAFYGEARPMLIDLVLDCDEQFEQKEYSYTQRDGTTLTAETIRKNHDGTQVYLWGKASRLYDKNGNLTGAIESVRDITERKHLQTDLERKHGELQASYEQLTAAEEELREQYEELVKSGQQIRTNEERFIMAQDVGHTGSWEYNLVTRELWVSSEGLHIFGFMSEDGNIRIDDIYACIPEQERVRQAFTDLITKGQEYNLEFSINPADGSAPRTVHSVARLDKDAGGKPLRVICVSQDITERKKTETALQAVSTELQQIFRNMINAFVVWESVFDENGTYVSFRFGWFNDAYARIAKVKYEDVRGKDVFEVWPATERSWVEVYGSVATSGIPRVFDMYHEPTKGWYHCNAYRPTGSPEQVCVIFEDITERRKDEEELRSAYEQLTAAEEELRSQYEELSVTEQRVRESEQRFRGLIQNSSDMIRILDRNGLIAYSSPSTLRLVGYDPANLLGKDPLDYVHPHDRERVKEALGKVFDKTNPGTPTEYRIRHRDGHYIDVESIASNQLDTPGIDGVVATTRPIAERKKGEILLREWESKFTNVFRSSPVALTLVSATDGTFVDINDTFGKNSGYSRDEVVGRTAEMLGFFTDNSEYGRFISCLRDKRAVQGMELKCRIKNGEIRTCRFSSGIIMMDGIPHILSSVEDFTEHRNAEEALLKSRQQLEDAMELAHLVNWEYDLRSGTLTFDNRFYALCGTSAEREGGSRMSTETYAREFVHPDDRHTVADEMEKASKSTDPDYVSRREHRIVRRDGEIRHVLTLIRLMRSTEGRVIKVYGTIQDFTDQKRAEEALRESEERFRGMAERSSDLILILSKEMSPTYVSPSARSIIGYDPEELVGKSPEFAMATIFSQAGPDVMKAAGTIMKGNLVENTELRVRRKDGALIYVNMHAVPVLQEGVLAGVQVSMRDITAGKKAELALLESEEKFRSFVENANEIVFSLTPDGTFTYVSPNWTELLGHDTRDVIGRPAAEYIHPDDFPRNRDFFFQAVTTGKKMSGIEYRIRHKDGTWLWHSQSISPVRDTGGRVITIQGICHDITERRQAEEALRQAQKKLSLLSSITRHDISNQLLVLNGFIGLLHKKIPDPSYEEYFSRITKAGNQILGMIKFTREYEKIGVHTPVWQVLATVVDDAGKGILPGQVTLKTDIHAGTEVFADPLIVKAFFNLLDNSVRHGQRVTEIRVSTHTSGGDLVVVWEDNGVGIAMEEKEQIFERGFGKNTGLGMFLVREILSLTGITITETGEPGTGARFEIVVPDGTWREAGNGRTGEREYQDRY